jgi:hypothetical protein
VNPQLFFARLQTAVASLSKRQLATMSLALPAAAGTIKSG